MWFYYLATSRPLASKIRHVEYDRFKTQKLFEGGLRKESSKQSKRHANWCTQNGAQLSGAEDCHLCAAKHKTAVNIKDGRTNKVSKLENYGWTGGNSCLLQMSSDVHSRKALALWRKRFIAQKQKKIICSYCSHYQLHGRDFCCNTNLINCSHE